MKNYKLTIELVPSSCWYSNVRSNVSKEVWDVIRKKAYKLAGNRCEICKDTGRNQGVKHLVECHEIWQYNDIEKTQILIGLIALCPYCHKTKHVGLAQINNEEEIVINQLMKVNEMTKKEAVKYIQESFVVWNERSMHEWELDISYIDEYLKD